MSFRTRIVIGIVVCVILPWIMTYFVSDYYTEDVLVQRAVQQSEQSLRTIEMSIRQSFDNLMYISTFFQFDSEFKQLLKSYRLIDPSSEGANQQIALHKLQIQTYLDGFTNTIRSTYITIMTDNGLYYTNYPTYNFNPQQFYQEPWIEEMRKLNNYDTFWLGAQTNYVTDDVSASPYVITMGKVMKTSGKIEAYIILSTLESEFGDKLRNFADSNDHLYYLTDEQGLIISSLTTNGFPLSGLSVGRVSDRRTSGQGLLAGLTSGVLYQLAPDQHGSVSGNHRQDQPHDQHHDHHTRRVPRPVHVDPDRPGSTDDETDRALEQSHEGG